MPTRLENAHKIARAASCLDYLKNSHSISTTDRAEAKQHAEYLHDIATEMAGDQANEIYAPDDNDLISVSSAARLCVCANT
jgi:hypothetical protein